MHPLKKYRIEHAIPPSELALRLNISRIQLWRIENNERGPSMDLATRIASLTDGEVRVEDLVYIPHGWRMIKDDQVAKLSSLDP